MEKCSNCTYKEKCSDTKKSRDTCTGYREYFTGGVYPGGTPPFYLCDICKYGSKKYLCLEDNHMNRAGFKTLPEGVEQILWVTNYGLECNIETCDHFEED